jgi:transketolase
MQPNHQELTEYARQARISVLEMLTAAGSGHTASPLGLAELFVYLYHAVLRGQSGKPGPVRDRLVLSAGHVVPIRYAVMAQVGLLEQESLPTLRQFGSPLQGHPSVIDLPALETSSGPLGQGLSQAIGFALAARISGNQERVFCVMSDGEHQEGQTWEAIQFAGARSLSNLVACVDVNGIQISGSTQDILPMTKLAEQYRSFGWEVCEINGNSFDDLERGFADIAGNQPRALLLTTTPGKGVHAWEGDYRWHGKVPTAAELAGALQELAGTHV